MKKYWHVLNVGIQNTLVYRVNFLFRAFFGLIPLFAIISLWKAVYSSKSGDVGDYSLSDMISYYLLVTIVDALTAVYDDDWQIAGDIRDGQISQFLLKPIDYLAYRFTLFSAGRMIYTALALIPITLIVFLHRKHFVVPDVSTLALFGCSILLTAALQFLLSYTMALLAFWFLEISTFIFIVFAFEYIAGGHLFPLDILPPALAKLMMWTPFPYQMFFPVSVYLGKISGSQVYTGLIIQAGWVLVAFLLARFMWNRGIRKYSAVGG